MASASASPSASPSKSPSASPSISPSVSPSVSSSGSPSRSYSLSPSRSPSLSPSPSPSTPAAWDGDFRAPIPRFTGTSYTSSSRGAFVSPIPRFIGGSDTSTHSSGRFVSPIPRFTGHCFVHSSGSFRAPMPRFSNAVPNHSRGAFVSPMPSFGGYSRTLPISIIYRGIVMNLITQAISTRSNFDFNSIADFNGRILLASDTGIYPADGDSDNGTRINAKMKTGSMDFGDTYMKYAKGVWITHRTNGYLRVIFTVDEDTNHPVYKDTKIAGDRMVEERVKPPRGLKGRFYTFELDNLSGADFDIDSINIIVESIRMEVR